MTASSQVTRKFERMFPGIAHENDQYEKTLEAKGRVAAEAQRRIHRQTQTNNIKMNLKNAILLGTLQDDFENGKETFIKAGTGQGKDANI